MEVLPSDFSKWRTVHSYFQIWSEKTENVSSILEEILKRVGALRSKMGRKQKASLCIIDSQSVKNTETAKEKGYDGDKKISGIKNI